MSALLQKRKSPCCLAAHTGWNSYKILIHLSTINRSMSIYQGLSIAKIIFGRVREPHRLHKLWIDTGREIHALALKRHPAGIKEQIWRNC